MALITKKLQWYLVSTDRNPDTIQSLADRLSGTNISVNLLGFYFTWNDTNKNYDKLSVVAARTLEINRGYWIYVNSFTNTLTGKVIDGYVRGATVFQDLNFDSTHTTGEFRTTTNNQGLFTANGVDYTVRTPPTGPDTVAPIIAFGGIDVSTNKPNPIILRGYPQSGVEIVLSPISTLIVKLVQDPTILTVNTVAEAETMVATGLDIPLVNINNDPIQTADTSLFNANIRVAQTAKLAAKLDNSRTLTTSSTSPQTEEEVVESAFVGLAKVIASKTTISGTPSTTFSLNANTTLDETITQVKVVNPDTDYNDTVVANVSEIVAISNAAVDSNASTALGQTFNDEATSTILVACK